jgi:hypothetical protein
MRGSQLMTPGDVIELMEDGAPVKCRVLSCLATDDGACRASLEYLEGDKSGERFQAVLRAGPPPQQDAI